MSEKFRICQHLVEENKPMCLNLLSFYLIIIQDLSLVFEFGLGLRVNVRVNIVISRYTLFTKHLK